MKTTTFTKSMRTLGTFMILMLLTLTATTVQAQETRTVKGIISDENGPLEGVSIVLKGTSVGTSTDSKGAFTFPKALAPKDVLVISYLGFETVKYPIKEDTSTINVTLTADAIEFVGAPNSNKPYKSKRSKS